MKCTHNIERWSSVVPHLLQVYKKHKIDPILRILLNTSLQENITLQTLLTKHPNINFRPYKQLFEQQQLIGWEQIKYGRWTTQWKLVQLKYESNTELNNWIIAIQKQIQITLYQRWKYRNQQLHPEKNSDHTRKSLLSCMKAAYTREKDMLEHQRFPFSKAIEEWETKPTIDIRRWHKRNIPYIKQCIKIHKAQIKNQTQDIQTFYIGTTQDTPTTSTQTQRKKQKQ